MTDRNPEWVSALPGAKSNYLDPADVRKQAAAAREAAEHAWNHSEYPGYGRSCHNGHALALDRLADTLEEIGAAPPADIPGDQHASRKARRVYWLKRKAAVKQVEAAALSARSHDMGSSRPMGQPLQGLPARQRAQRNAIERANRVDFRAHETRIEADRLAQRAKAAEANSAIYAGDPQALDKLRAKLRTLEARQAAAKPPKAPPLLNYRAADGKLTFPKRYDEGDEVFDQVEMTKAEYKRFRGEEKWTRIPKGCGHRVRGAHSPGNKGYFSGKWCAVFLTDSKVHPRPEPGSETPAAAKVPAYARANLSKQVATVKQRIAQLEAAETREARADRRIGDVIVRDNLEFQKVELHFPSKPDADTRALVKRHGFRWVRTAGCWSRGIGSNTEYGLRALAKHLGAGVVSDGLAEAALQSPHGAVGDYYMQKVCAHTDTENTLDSERCRDCGAEVA